MNTVESVEAFSSEILQGHWDNVLRIVSQLKIPEKKLMDLYEQVRHIACEISRRQPSDLNMERN